MIKTMTSSQATAVLRSPVLRSPGTANTANTANTARHACAAVFAPARVSFIRFFSTSIIRISTGR